jgi:hypothetical protein
MGNKNAFCMPPGDRQPAKREKGADSSWHCGVSEDHFPLMGTCCQKKASMAGPVYEAICPYYDIWSSLPEGVSLKVTHIFDCAAWGYGKRIVEEGQLE